MELSDVTHPKVRLDFLRSTAIIVSHPTGVVYSNQACGFSCMQPELEGILVPLDLYMKFESGSFASFEGELTDYFIGPKHNGTGAPGGLDRQDADFIDHLLEHLPGDIYARVDRKNMHESMEAWVWITIELAPKHALTDTISGLPEKVLTGVLIWPNSD